MDGKSRPDLSVDADDLRLMEELLGTGRDLDKSVEVFRRHRLSCEARARVPDSVDRPRFVTSTDWDHRFPGTDRDVKVRWAFDRRLWSVVVLHLRGAGGAWCKATPDETLDVTESLVLANAEALYDVRGWGCTEGATLPNWATVETIGRRDASEGLSSIVAN